MRPLNVLATGRCHHCGDSYSLLCICDAAKAERAEMLRRVVEGDQKERNYPQIQQFESRLRLEIALGDAYDEIENLKTRRDALLALVCKVSSETPLPDEADDLRAQVAALVAEVGTGRSQRTEALRELRELRAVEQPTEWWKNDMLDQIINILEGSS